MSRRLVAAVLAAALGAGLAAPPSHAETRTTQGSRLWRAATPARRLLFVFLGGTWTSPRDYRALAASAAEDGFDVVSLRYDNRTLIGGACLLPYPGETPSSCYEMTRGESVFGAGAQYGAAPSGGWSSPHVNVPLSASVVGRLVSVLREASWGAYLTADPASPYDGALPAWDRIVVGGHSQGGGSALFLATHVAVHRAFALSAPDDTAAGGSPDWLTRRPATPPADLYGLRNTSEGGFGDGTARNWAALGLPGEETSVDVAPPPYGNSHRLVTETSAATCGGRLLPCSGLERHGATAADRWLERDSAGAPVLAPAWRYMLRGEG